MFIFTQDEALAELKGTVRKDKKPSIDDTFRITMLSQYGIVILGEYKSEYDAALALACLSFAIKRGDNLFKMPRINTTPEEFHSMLTQLENIL